VILCDAGVRCSGMSPRIGGSGSPAISASCSATHPQPAERADRNDTNVTLEGVA